MYRYKLIALLSLLLYTLTIYGQGGFSVKGRLIDEATRVGVAYATVSVSGQSGRAAMTDSLGGFLIEGVAPGIYSLEASSPGYLTLLTPQYQISDATAHLEIEIQKNSYELENTVIKPSPFPRVTASPISMRRIGLQEIEKSPGANRDVSRIVQSYPGVAFSPASYRNDLIVRGGAPSENKFYLDGIEIPNINHFSTQGATGGPVSIVNADLIREIDFYTGAFPANKGGALSSMLDVRLKDGSLDKQSFKFTVGASEVGASGSGHIGEKTTYLLSVRQSYLQMLFKMIGLPFLPNYVDAQFKVKHRFSKRDELTILGVAGFDTMTLNDEATTETAEYILGYLPEIEQETFTVGAAYKHYGDGHTHSLIASHSYTNNRNTKYLDNDSSLSDNLTMKIGSLDQKSMVKSDNSHFMDSWTLRYGAELSYSPFSIDSYQRSTSAVSTYSASIDLMGWAGFFSADYVSPNDRLTTSVGMRMDGNNFSSRTSKLWRQFSPRGSISYALKGGFSLNGSVGQYFQMPNFTSLSYRNDEGVAVNSSLDYMSVVSSSVGVDWRYEDRLFISLEGFYKYYSDGLLSVADDIPLASSGTDYGIVGNEELLQTVSGRAYGGELMVRWQIPGKLSFVSSLTLFSSEYRDNAASAYEPSSWDNRFISNTSGTYFFGKGWSVGAKISAIGGAPYTPYDLDRSSYVSSWDISGSPYYDYSLYNSERLKAYAQVDLRVDKVFYFNRWMLGLYLDIQNLSKSSYTQADIPLSTGVVENPTADASDQRYVMKYLSNVSGTLLPTLGITIEF